MTNVYYVCCKPYWTTCISSKYSHVIKIDAQLFKYGTINDLRNSKYLLTEKSVNFFIIFIKYFLKWPAWLACWCKTNSFRRKFQCHHKSYKFRKNLDDFTKKTIPMLNVSWLIDALAVCGRPASWNWCDNTTLKLNGSC